MLQLVTLLFLLPALTGELILFDFSSIANTNGWSIVDDRVMSGSSQRYMSITDDGHAKYSGDVSLENNGGF